MFNATFQRYIARRKSSKISPNLILLCLLLFFIASILLCDYLSIWLPIFSILVLITTAIYYSISSYFTFEDLSGEIDSVITINSNFIEIKEERIEMLDIEKIDFHFTDYYGKTDHYSSINRLNFNPRKLVGVRNCIYIFEKDLLKKIYFQLNHAEHHKELYPFIIEMIKAGKISFLRGIEILEISDYDKIQEFKHRHLR